MTDDADDRDDHIAEVVIEDDGLTIKIYRDGDPARVMDAVTYSWDEVEEMRSADGTRLSFLV